MAVAGDIFIVSAFGTAFSQRIILTHHYRLAAINPGVSDEAARDSLLDAVRGGVGGGDVLEGPYLDLLPPEYTLDWWQAQLISPVRRAFNVFLRGNPGAHLDSTETANQSVAITLRTNNAGRDQVGTKKIGPIPQSANAQSNGSVAPAYLTLLTTFKNSLISDVVDLALGATWNPIFYHGPTAGDWNLITTGVAQQQIRTMSRRTVGRGV